MKKMAMPKTGANMSEAFVAKWLVKMGDCIKDGDPVMEAESDKTILEICATESGIVSKLLVDEGTIVACGTDILELEGEKKLTG